MIMNKSSSYTMEHIKREKGGDITPVDISNINTRQLLTISNAQASSNSNNADFGRNKFNGF
jgi:hypothetical protein